MLRLALVSPAKDTYSETFIKAQRELLPFDVLFYYGGQIPKFIEKKGQTAKPLTPARISSFVRRKFSGSRFSENEVCFQQSLRLEKPDVLLAHYGNTANALLHICHEVGVPLIVHFHGYDASVFETISKCNGYKNLFVGASRVIAVSRRMVSDLIALGCPEEKLFLNPYGPQNAYFDVSPRFESNHFIALGRFTNKKAPYYTLLAFAKVVQKHPTARLTIGGTGELLNTCRNLARYLKIDKNVSFPGVLSPDRFRELLADSIAFVQHSIVAENGDSEGTPVAVLEASAAGLPVVATNHAGIPDVIQNGTTGLLVEEHDVDGMAAAMIRILEDKGKARSIGEAGRLSIKQNFSMERHIDKLAEIIRGALEQPKSFSKLHG